MFTSQEVEVEIRQKWSGRSYTEPLGGHHPSNTSAVPPSPSSPPSPYSRRSEWTLLNTALSDSREFELCKLINRWASDTASVCKAHEISLLTPAGLPMTCWRKV